MPTLEKSIDVEAPVRKAYNQWTQFEQFPLFMDGVVAVRQLSDNRLHWCAEIAGKREEWDAEISEQIPDNRIAWHSVDGAQHAGVITFHYVSGDKTRIMLQVDYDTHGIVETVGDKLGFVNRTVEGDLKRFKQLVEKLDVESGGWRGTILAPPQRR